jgi:murein L,D-transpeptidase YcbB/YkuD
MVPGHFSARVGIVFVCLAAACGPLRMGTTETGREMDAALRQTLQNPKPPAYVTHDGEGARLWKQTRRFYDRRQFSPAWIENASPRPQMDALINAIHAASLEGLDPELYSASLLDQRKAEASKGFLSKKGFDPKEAGAMDVWLVYLYMKYASDLADGVSDLAHADPRWKIRPEAFDPLAELERALRDNRVAESLMELTPTDADYRALRKALADYRAQASRGGWPAVPSNVHAKPDQQSPHVAALARRLAASGDFKGAVPADGRPAVYGPELQDAVRRFQRRHGLTDDGVVGPALAAELNVPVDARIRQIELNMERWRWLPRDLGDRSILVNIPDMRLDVRERGNVPLTMRVVVGKQDTPTPIFNDEMTYLVFAPYWNVPPDIAEKETLPSVLKDPGFLERTNMEVVDESGRAMDAGSIDLNAPEKYRFRQRPGTSNSLGLVKFMFPNQFNVYLHDTPADSLFARASRSLSHGCVRLEQPEKLAAYVLRDQPEWTPDRINDAMHGQEERTVKLKAKIPVYIGYWTAKVSADGLVQFRKDVYGIDGQLTRKLAERLERLRKSATAVADALSANKPEIDARAGR